MSTESDFEKREYWLDFLRQRSLQVLADRFFVSTTAIWQAEKKPLNCRTMSQNAEIKRLRREYHSVRTLFNRKYIISAIAKRHGLNESAVSTRWHRRQKRSIENKAQAFYARREVRVVSGQVIGRHEQQRGAV